MAVVSVGSAKSGGTSTLVLALASAAAASGVPVIVVDASKDMDLVNWSVKSGTTQSIQVLRCEGATAIDQAVSRGVSRGALVIIDAGTKPETLLHGARCADTVLIPVRFSPLSAYAAAATDIFLTAKLDSAAKRRVAFVATCITQIPSRIARSVEDRLARSATRKLSCGLAQRAAFEAQFLYGGTLFSLTDAQAPGLLRARDDARSLAAELQLLPNRATETLDRIAAEALRLRQPRGGMMLDRAA